MSQKTKSLKLRWVVKEPNKPLAIQHFDIEYEDDEKRSELELKLAQGLVGGYVEMVIGFRGKSGNSLETLSELPADQKEEAMDLTLKLAREVLQKNHGRMMVETNGKKPNILITLRFSIERRNVVYYAPITL